MTRIWDLQSIADDEIPSSESVTILSDGIITKKISITNMKRVLVPIASTSELGKVRIGDGLEIDSNGTLSVIRKEGYSLPIASPNVLGGIKVGTNLKINESGILDTKFPLSLATTSNPGLVTIGNNINVNTNGVISVTFPDFSIYPDTGIKIGNDTDMTMIVQNGIKPVIKSLVNGTFNIEINDSESSDGVVEVGFINSSMSSALGGEYLPAFVPDQAGDKVNLGTSILPWNSVYAVDLYGNLDGIANRADTLLVDNSNYRTGSIPANPNTIVARDSSADVFASVFHGDLNGISDQADSLLVDNEYRIAAVDTYGEGTADTVVVRDGDGAINATRLNGISDKADFVKVVSSYYAASVEVSGDTIAARDNQGNLKANYFIGIATQAQFADLAEKYLSDKHYDVGTVVIFGGTQEITTTNIKGDHRVAGVISGEPAYLMNNASHGQPVALRGKVPVKVIGKVAKGDLLICSAVPGYAMSVGSDKSHGISIFAKSIEDKTNFDNGIVTAVIL